MPDEDPGLRLQALLLADHANVREGLLSVLSAGLTRLGSGTFPMHFLTTLVLMVYVPPDRVADLHEIDVRFKYPAEAETIAEAKLQFQIAEAEAFPGEGRQVPLTLPMLPIPFPRIGQVDVQVSIAGQHAGELSFWIVPQTTLLGPPALRAD
jgi:hypothetical protein